MRRAVDPAAWLALVLLLGAVLFPALFLGRVVAPETTLKNVPPWRLQWGPAPSPQAPVQRTFSPMPIATTSADRMNRFTVAPLPARVRGP
jgi:hypothetical protein